MNPFGSFLGYLAALFLVCIAAGVASIEYGVWYPWLALAGAAGLGVIAVCIFYTLANTRFT